ncbi:hypothetical protein C440_03318 [Haloferax mucosum ATCC BAA-1512]|uniref:Preprotein translocase subunit TatC n=1 Tax=Haloferax mucosum ATCC BAA-1512 TaxID=662479 RepID=M0IIZ6_9EURY|nr:hypothetical protein [Haloferax mucosum]ELZ96771.1 hypothetical protein C440_03318 [Haloferax mucosum ATCC BAA-1512]
MDATGVVESADPRRHGLSPLGATLRCRVRRLTVSSLLVAVVVFAVVRDPSTLSPTAGIRTDALAVQSPVFLVRLELTALAGALGGGAHLVLLTGRDAAVTLRAAARHLVAAAVAFAICGALTWLAAPSVGGVLTSAGWVTFGSPRAVLEFELFFPVVVGLGAATAPLLVGFGRAGALPNRLGERTKGVALLFTVAFAAFFSPPDPATFALYAMPPLTGLAVAIAWTEF